MLVLNTLGYYFIESWKDTGIYYCIGPLLFAVRKAPRGVSTGFVFDLQPLAAYCETRNTQTQTSVTTTTNSNLSLLCYVPEESALSFYLKMEAVGSSEMLVTIYENQQSLTVTAAFTHASLSAHSHVKCVLKWSKTHIMHCTYTAHHHHHHKPHTNQRCQQLCKELYSYKLPLLNIQNGTDIMCIIFLHYWCLITKLIIPLAHILSAIHIYMVGSPHSINITSIILHLNIPSLQKHQILVPKIIPRYKRSVHNCSIQTTTLFSLR